MTEYIDVLNNPYLSQQQKADEINRIGEAERTAIDIENQKALNRIKRGSALQVASSLPILNIPYVGTGIGGGLYEAGNAIMEGKDAQGIWDDAKRGFIIGETVGAIPYVGKYAGKTKAGEAVGNKASSLFSKLMGTNAGQKLGDFAKKAEDVLMTDIKAFNPNKQTVYHGSPYDFDKFSNEAIGTGEGAQAHGHGHYSALDKDIADKRYRKRLTTSSKEEVEIDNRYKPLFEEAEKKYDNLLNNLYKQKQNGEITEEFYQNAIDNSKEAIEVNNILASWEKEVASLKGKKLTPNEGQLYKLSIPKDDVMLREGATLAEQPKLLNRLGMNNTDNVKQEMANLLDYIKNNKSSLPSEELNSLRKQYADLSYKKMLNDPQLKSEAYYEALADSLGSEQLANEFLLDKGIKGISYNGGIDGEARVIFNPNDIDIVRKYYNQPELWQTLKGLKPNEGAELMAIENVLRYPQFPMNETDFKNYENLGLNYYQHIFQPNSVEIPGYGTVTFGRKNRGKDDITNFKMYPDLFELLQGSKKVNRTNYKNEIDREYDYLENPNNKLYQFLIEDIAEKGKKYKMMQNKETGK